MGTKLKLFFAIFFCITISTVKSQTTVYYLDQSNASDSISIKNYFNEIGSRIKQDAHLFVNLTNRPQYCQGVSIDRCLSNQLAINSFNAIATDSLSLNLMVQKVNELINPINNIDFYFFLSAASLKDNRLNQFINQMLLATDLYAKPQTTVYLLLKDQNLQQKLSFLKTNKNYKQYEVKFY
jgi:hypothetical protein